MSLLLGELALLQTMFIVIDAIDECDEHLRTSLGQNLFRLIENGDVRVLL